MNSSLIARFTALTLAVLAGSGIAAALARTAERGRPRVAVVLAGQAAGRGDLLAAASGVAVRVPRGAAEQLAVTHLLAARRYDTVVAVGVDRRVALAPVARRYPGVRFVIAAPSATALRRAIAATR